MAISVRNWTADFRERGVEMKAKDEILEKIAAGFDNSRKLADELHYNQEYIRRVISKLAGDGLIEITREPRGHTYVIKIGATLMKKTELVWNAVLDENTCDECRALHGKLIREIGFTPPLHGPNDPQGRHPCRCTYEEGGLK